MRTHLLRAYWYQLFSIDRRVEHCRIQSGGKPIDVLNVHLEGYSRKDRVLQACRLAEIVASIGPARALVLGDFNAPCLSSGQLHEFADDPLLDFRNDTTLSLIREQDLNLVTEDKDRFYTVPAASPTRGIDHILLGTELDVVEADVVKEATTSISDHLPVVAQIRI